MGKSDKINLRIPGPTPLPFPVLKAVSRQMINHRGPSYEEIQKRVTENLKYFFQTKNDIFLMTSSGMGGLEAAVSNFFSAKDTLLYFTCGEFGNRWAEIGRRYGANVIHVKLPVGKAVSEVEVEKALQRVREVKGVFFTHIETSVGVLNNITKLSAIVSRHEAKPLLLVDSISALGGVDLPMDRLNIDILVTASQKAWMSSPGLAMIAVSKRAWDFHTRAKMPHYYFDISMYKEFAQKNQTPATCALSTIFGLDKSLELMRKEGRENIFKRHLKLMKLLREGIRKLGLDLFVSDEDASPTVTSIKIPDGVDGHKWLQILREKYQTVLVGGMGETKGKIIRIAHMGFVSKKDIEGVLDALKKSVKEARSKN